MGILRADRLSGLGGANAINGSVHFPNDGATGTGNFLRVDRKDNSDFNLSKNDFTIEFWFNSENVGSTLHPVTFAASTVSASSDVAFYARFNGGVVNFNCFEGNNTIGACSTGSVNAYTWYHVAYVRSGSTFTIYLDGTSAATASSAEAVNYDAGWNFNIGSAYTNVYHYNGFLSNLRIVNGTALYTSNFTVPNRLEAVENTVLLCCQSPGNVLQEASGKSIHLVRTSATGSSDTSNGPAHASRFVPDVGEDYGTTFVDNTKFDTLSYMVPPGGTTAQSNRGRGVFGGGYTTVPSGAAVKRIYYIQIDSMGTSAEFGDTNKAAAWGQGGCSSSTRGLFTGGTNPTNLDTIDYITIATTSNALDFGDLNVTHGYTASCSNNTRGLTGGGRGGSPTARLAQIDYNTIATLGNGQDFGDLTQSRMGLGAVASSTRAVFTGGNGSPADPSTVYNIIDYVEFATTANATDFGDMTDEHTYHGSCSSSTRGIIYGGVTSYGPTVTTNIIEYITIASTGNGTDFGDVRDDGEHAHGTSNSIRGVFAGGVNPYRNSIDFITITTTGNGVDWGDLPDSSGSYAYAAGLSDSHGGIS